MLFGPDSPFSAQVARGNSKLVIVTGENASGKSLFVRVSAAALQRDDGALAVTVSIRERAGGGPHELGNLRRAMMFGDETEQSTGATSVGVVQTAFDNLDREQGSVLITDEPELGLSEAYARALGKLIGRRSRDLSKACRGVFVVTHSRPLVRGLLDGYEAPTHVSVGADDDQRRAGLQRWLNDDEHRTVEQLLGLRDAGLDRWRRVNQLLD